MAGYCDAFEESSTPWDDLATIIWKTIKNLLVSIFFLKTLPFFTR